MIVKAAVLAGGLGTRLKGILGDIPKPMAPVGGFPFLHHLLHYLSRQGIREVFLCTGYCHEVISRYFGNQFMGMSLRYTVEQELLGTGGALMPVLAQWQEPFFLLNGDTFFEADLAALSKAFLEKRPLAAVCLKPMRQESRYGAVQLEGNRIVAFEEKKYFEEGCINAGVSLLSPALFEGKKEGETFSYERDLFTPQANRGLLHGIIQDRYFLDIGIPEDYQRAQEEIPGRFLVTPRFLFLDRDGVINQRISGDYVRQVETFHFLPKVPESLALLRRFYQRMFVVTNQQGIGKGFFTEEDLSLVHRHMSQKLVEAGGTLDGIYHCPSLASANDPSRKPGPGMAFLAKQTYPEVQFKDSIMVGDSISDLVFGRNLGMLTVWIAGEDEVLATPELAGLRATSLAQLAQWRERADL